MANNERHTIKFLGFEFSTLSGGLAVIVLLIILAVGIISVKYNINPSLFLPNSLPDTIPITGTVKFSDRNEHYGIHIGVIPSELVTTTTTNGSFKARAPKIKLGFYNVYVIFNDGSDRPMFHLGTVDPIYENGKLVRGEFNHTFPDQQ